jgi:uncharacterized membrane protein YoaK (UPF0700 family)
MLLGFLAFTSGYIDALALLGLGVFESFMSGNSILLGIGIGRGDILAVTGSAVALLAYVGGVALGVNIVNATLNPQEIWPPGVTKAFIIEFLLLLVFAIGGFFAGTKPSHFVVNILIASGAVAMGIQSAAAHGLGLRGIATTYVTGTWTTFASNLAHRHRSSSSESTAGESKTRLEAWVLVVYILSAGVGGIAEIHWLLKAALIPAISIGLLVVIARFRMR